MASEKPSQDPSDDLEEYKLMSLSPGGFGEQRADIWSKLLHAEPQKISQEPAEEDSTSHPDERQIRLDTERSFVLYPVDSKTDKDTLQSELHDLLVEIFQKRPKLHYFQGYHDIITVLLLTLPRELQLPCAEQLSLQRVRDSMGSTLEPVLGLLRVMKNLLREADPQFAELLERTSPLPYYALSNLLTLFSHDMPTLPLIQHVFDYLLCRPPIFVVYLASAIILCRKEDVERLEEEGEEGMLHSILSALPEIVDESNDSPAEEIQAKEELLSEDLPPDIKRSSRTFGTAEPAEATQTKEEPSEDLLPNIEPTPLSLSLDSNAPQADISNSPSTDIGVEPSTDVSLDPDLPDAPIAEPEHPLDELATEVKTEPPDTSTEELDSPPPANRRKALKPKYTLMDILNMSDALHRAHPPASLQVSSIMGPQSVMFTWSTRVSDMPSNDEAERMVDRLDLIVYPEPPVVESKERDTSMRRRKPFKKRGGPGTVGLLVGAGLVLGVAVAVSVYSARHGGDHTRDWRKWGRWIGGVLHGASEKVIRYRS